MEKIFQDLLLIYKERRNLKFKSFSHLISMLVIFVLFFSVVSVGFFPFFSCSLLSLFSFSFFSLLSGIDLQREKESEMQLIQPCDFYVSFLGVFLFFDHFSCFSCSLPSSFIFSSFSLFL